MVVGMSTEFSVFFALSERYSNWKFPIEFFNRIKTENIDAVFLGGRGHLCRLAEIFYKKKHLGLRALKLRGVEIG